MMWFPISDKETKSIKICYDPWISPKVISEHKRYHIYLKKKKKKTKKKNHISEFPKL